MYSNSLKYLCRILIVLLSALGMARAALAANQGGQGAPRATRSVDEMKYKYELSMDAAIFYLRNPSSGGSSNTGGRLSFGGNFASWVGMDVMGLYQVKDKSFLGAATLRFVPIDWLFLKAGYGGFFDRAQNQMRPTPVFGGGLKGYFSEYYYMIVEGITYQVGSGKSQIGAGIGLGIIF